MSQYPSCSAYPMLRVKSINIHYLITSYELVFPSGIISECRMAPTTVCKELLTTGNAALNEHVIFSAHSQNFLVPQNDGIIIKCLQFVVN